MADFEVSGRKYRSRNMPAMTQLHVLQALAPIVTSMRSLFVDEDAGAGAVSVIAKAISEMPSEKLDFVVEECMKICERERHASEGGGWVKIWNETIHQPQFDDIGLKELGTVVTSVLRANYGNFIGGSE